MEFELCLGIGSDMKENYGTIKKRPQEKKALLRIEWETRIAYRESRVWRHRLNQNC